MASQKYQLACLFKNLFGLAWKKTPRLITGLEWQESTSDQWLPSQRACNEESVSMLWHHYLKDCLFVPVTVNSDCIDFVHSSHSCVYFFMLYIPFNDDTQYVNLVCKFDLAPNCIMYPTRIHCEPGMPFGVKFVIFGSDNRMLPIQHQYIA